MKMTLGLTMGEIPSMLNNLSKGATMAKRLCPIHGLWTKEKKTDRCPKCTKSRAKSYDRFDRNKESTKFYSSSQWKKVRALVLAAEPLCRMCKRPAQMVDHIVPILKDGCKLCRDNLQPLCRSCHGYKTKTENYIHRPRWMPAPLVPVTMVCGAPGSGKTSYCENHKSERDMIIDLDYIRDSIIGKGMYQWSSDERLDEAVLQRNAILCSLAKMGVEEKYDRVWFVLSAAKRETREWWATQLKCDVIVMSTPASVCRERIRSDERRQGREKYFLDLVDLWFNEYTQSHLDGTELGKV